jgi:hypothetical protein
MTRAMRTWFLCGCAAVSALAAPAAWRAGATHWGSTVDASAGSPHGSSPARGRAAAFEPTEREAGRSLAGASRRDGARAR